MRIVLDTNVFISSFFGGNPRTIIDLWKDGRLTVDRCPTPREKRVAFPLAPGVAVVRAGDDLELRAPGGPVWLLRGGPGRFELRGGVYSESYGRSAPTTVIDLVSQAEELRWSLRLQPR